MSTKENLRFPHVPLVQVRQPKAGLLGEAYNVTALLALLPYLYRICAIGL